MKASKDALDLIKEFEGFRAKAYKCPAGKWTVGYGHTGDVKEGDLITEDRASKILAKDVGDAEKAINTYVTVTLSQNEFDALISLVFNIGIGAFIKSTLLKKLNKSDFDGAAREFLRWDKVNKKPNRGLARRRAAEMQLFTSGAKDEMPQAVDSPDKPIIQTRTVKSSTVAGGVGVTTLAVSAIESVAPAVPVVSEVAEVAQNNAMGLVIALSLILIAFAAYMVILKRDDHRKH